MSVNDNCINYILAIFISLLISYFINKHINQNITNKNNNHLFEQLYLVVVIFIIIKYKLSLHTYKYLLLSLFLINISYIDINTYTIPNIYILFILINNLVFDLIENTNIINTFINTLIICVPLFITSIALKKILHKETIGGGDIKLLFVLSLYFDIYHNIFAIFISCLSCLIYMLITKKTKILIPFGPFISFAYILLLLSL